MMKKQILAVLLASTLSVASLEALAASAGDGIVTFTGIVSATTCTANPQELTRTVELPTINPNDYDGNAHDLSNTATPISINITNCPEGIESVTATYQYDSHDERLHAIKNMGTARGFAVQVNLGDEYHPTDRIVPGDTSSIAIASGGTGVLKLTASLNKFNSNEEAVVNGDINSPFQIALSYQ